MGARRDYLIHLLTEAAEIEHNLLCSYLYAAFSLKSPGEGLGAAEEKAVGQWHDAVLGVAIEEMGHLVLVNNLLVALGGDAHFDRANFPVPPGYHPAEFVIRLTPFTRETLQHFIFLERPEDVRVREGAGFVSRKPKLARTPTAGHLTPSTPDYETIGAFYAEIRAEIAALDDGPGLPALVEADGDGQIGAGVIDLPGVDIILTRDQALAALDTIVAQGEGGPAARDDNHFARFNAIAAEWTELDKANPDFRPAHAAAHDPVMRRPEKGLERVWITRPATAERLDLGNAVYALTLTLLAQAWAPALTTAQRKARIDAALALMHALGRIGRALARLPARDDAEGNAGLTFAVPRNLTAAARGCSGALLRERLRDLEAGARRLFGTELDKAFGQAAAALQAV